MFFRLLVTLFVLLAWNVAAGERPRVLTMTGTGIVALPPDMAWISIGVEVKSATAEAALSQNSTRMTEIFAMLKNQGIASKDVQTTQLAVHPQWNSQKTSYDKPLSITGYIATNVVQIRLRDLGSLGVVLDSLTKTGANRIQGVRFSVLNPTPHLDQARILAVAEAVRKARLFAKAAGVSLGDILAINETGNEPRPMFRAKALAMTDEVPIAGGELSLRAEITIQFAID